MSDDLLHTSYKISNDRHSYHLVLSLFFLLHSLYYSQDNLVSATSSRLIISFSMERLATDFCDPDGELNSKVEVAVTNY